MGHLGARKPILPPAAIPHPRRTEWVLPLHPRLLKYKAVNTPRAITLLPISWTEKSVISNGEQSYALGDADIFKEYSKVAACDGVD